MDVEIRSIASLYLEPVWVFYRGEEAANVAHLSGRRLAVGPPGSGTRAIAVKLLAANGIEMAAEEAAADTSPRAATIPVAGPPGLATASAATAATAPATRTATVLVPLGGAAAVDALRSGDVDAAVFVISPSSPMIQSMLQDNHLRLLQFHRHDAYARQFPFLSSATLPEGVIDLGRDLPPWDVDLVAPAANLVARPGLHPTLVPLLCKAITVAHERGDLLGRPGQFPSTNYVEWPVDPAAQEYFRSGPPFLQRYLPFWLASFVERRLLILVPFMAVLIGLVQALPRILESRVKKRFVVWYRELKSLEDEIWKTAQPSAHQLAQWHNELESIDAQASQIRVPTRYLHDVYALKQAISVVRHRISRAAGSDG
jgi:hypothetical protein